MITEPGVYAVASFTTHLSRRVFQQLSAEQNNKLFAKASIFKNGCFWTKFLVRPSYMVIRHPEYVSPNNPPLEWTIISQLDIQFIAESLAIYKRGALLELRKSRFATAQIPPIEIHDIDYPIIHPPQRQQLDISNMYKGDATIKATLQEAFDKRLLNSVLQYSTT